MEQKNDFSQGSVVANIVRLAIPMTLAQLVNVLYNVVDRMYIGRIPENATLALTGLGLCLPIITMVIAFANLYVQAGRWRAQAHGDLCRWTGDGSSADTYAFVDMEVSYEVWRNRLTLFVRGENLLGADTYVEESFDETSHTYGVYRLHPRRVMFLAMFRF